ncbi:BCL2/adenovirus E1B protein-interacting protein 3 isoform 2 [Camelus ferus]|nr:BCL2/adenovirus E1B protein-interacting protein 3 isoform 2 [Camelus ferus]
MSLQEMQPGPGHFYIGSDLFFSSASGPGQLVPSGSGRVQRALGIPGARGRNKDDLFSSSLEMRQLQGVHAALPLKRRGPGVTLRKETPGCRRSAGVALRQDYSLGTVGTGALVQAVSIYDGNVEKPLLDAQFESGGSHSEDSRFDHAPRTQTHQMLTALLKETHVVLEEKTAQSKEVHVERRKDMQSILKKSDQICSWSNRPEKIPAPPKEFLFKHLRCPSTLSMRNTSITKMGTFSLQFLAVLFFCLFCSLICCPLDWGSISEGV